MTDVTAAPARVLIADDHALYRDGLRQLLLSEAGFDVVGEAADGIAVVELARRLTPDVIVLDLAMPGMAGQEALLVLARLTPAVRVVVLTASPDPADMVRAFEHGARGFVSKVAPPHVVVDAIWSVMGGGYWAGREAAAGLRAALDSSRPAAAAQTTGLGITRRECDVLSAILDGCANSDIARRLGISEDTVKHHLTKLFDKTGVSNRLELAMFALDHRLVKHS